MAPLLLPHDLRLSPEQFALVCEADLQGGWEVFDSSTGFRLADGSVLSPDLVIELASASDSGPRGAEALRRKMALYQANGAQLGWLLFPEQRAVEIWPARPDAAVATEPQRLESALRLEGGDVLPGLVLELEEIWAA
ncbi:MAG: Uma2 family endonuclease [Synechococcus sp.]